MESGGVRFTAAIVLMNNMFTFYKPALQTDLAASPWNGALLQSPQREALVIEAVLCFGEALASHHRVITGADIIRHLKQRASKPAIMAVIQLKFS